MGDECEEGGKEVEYQEGVECERESYESGVQEWSVRERSVRGGV